MYNFFGKTYEKKSKLIYSQLIWFLFNCLLLKGILQQASALSVVSLGVFHSQEKCLKAEDVGSPERAFRIFGVAEA